MSANAADGVVNGHGQSHDVANLFVSDGSQFTTGGAENPTLTIVALALRQAYRAGDVGRCDLTPRGAGPCGAWTGTARPDQLNSPQAR